MQYNCWLYFESFAKNPRSNGVLIIFLHVSPIAIFISRTPSMHLMHPQGYSHHRLRNSAVEKIKCDLQPPPWSWTPSLSAACTVRSQPEPLLWPVSDDGSSLEQHQHQLLETLEFTERTETPPGLTDTLETLELTNQKQKHLQVSLTLETLEFTDHRETQLTPLFYWDIKVSQ